MRRADQRRGVLVPVANPIGLAQRLDHKPMGRFELDTSENFNRHYPDLASAVAPVVMNGLTDDAQANVNLVRQAMRDHLQAWTPNTELQSLRKTCCCWRMMPTMCWTCIATAKACCTSTRRALLAANGRAGVLPAQPHHFAGAQFGQPAV
ncbi:hypothetical protein [Rhodoferax antarcticus]|uniref:hypothetical protein n=1 Tax=Rhodoferax antarcticus TaxID=81479 RepID=UPI001FCF8CFB|nr:hypothetical protein [Rhodoferax antarcticus]